MASNRDMLSQPPVGIDLGTTYSVVAYLDGSGRPTTIPNSWGDLLTPSAVSFDDEEVIVGKEAVKIALVAPEGFADCFKRDMGRPEFRRRVKAQQVPPEILSAFLLESLRRDAEAKLGEVRRVVVTVPAYFDETRRRGTQEAGRLAGLEVLDIINEPTAAALAYGFAQGLVQNPSTDARRILVYDLGGGTFDVTVLELAGNVFRTLATDGDVQLGGRDFDERIVNYAAEQFVKTHGVDPRQDPRDATALWLDAQEVKHALSQRVKTNLVVSHAGHRLRMDISRELVEALCEDLIERTETTTQLVLAQTKLRWSDIDRVLLVGGCTRMPMVTAMLERISGIRPDVSLSPDEAVAHGAALYCGSLLGRGAADEPSGFRLINVNSHSLGVAAFSRTSRQRVTAVLIPKNTPLPHRAVRMFRTAEANQRTVRVEVVEGESDRPEECIALGNCVVRDLPPGLPTGAPVEVDFHYAANGRIAVTARMPSLRHAAHADIQHRRFNPIEGLDIWRKRLLGQSKVEQSSASQRDELQRRLASLHITLGTNLAGIAVPAALADVHDTANTAADSLRRARAQLNDAERAGQAAVSPHEKIRASAELHKQREAFERAQLAADRANVALAESALQLDFKPVALSPLLEQIDDIVSGLDAAAQD